MGTQRLAAGLLMYRLQDRELQVLLVHPGGPFYARRDEGVWSIPKGEPDREEELLLTAQREFTEETGFVAQGPFLELAPIRQKGGKLVHAWACAGDCDPSQLRSNTFTIEFPPGSGRRREFPEVDRAGWFGLREAKRRLKAAQWPLVEELLEKLT